MSDRAPLGGHPDPVLARSLAELSAACQKLLASVAEHQARGQSLERVLAMLLGIIKAKGATSPIVTECVGALQHMRQPDPGFMPAEFPDPSLLEEVIAILSPAAPHEPWRPRVVTGGKAGPDGGS